MKERKQNLIARYKFLVLFSDRFQIIENTILHHSVSSFTMFQFKVLTFKSNLIRQILVLHLQISYLQGDVSVVTLD